MSRALLWPIFVAYGILFTQVAVAAADETPAITPLTPPAATTTGTEDPQTTEAKAIFSAQCGWCHGDYGMAAAKGPQLAGTQMTEHQVEQRIRNGKPGYMPSFRKFLSDDQISLMAHYIKSLKPQS